MAHAASYASGSVALAALAILAPGTIRAEEGTGAPPRTVLFGSFDVGRSGFASFGAKRALAGTLDETGLVAMGTLGAGGSRDQLAITPGPDAAFRPAFQGSVLVGHQWALGRTFLSIFAGAELDRDRFPAAGGTARATGRVGARLQGEVWMHPTDDTLLTGTAILGSARGHLWVRAAGGYKVWRDLFVGPEVTHYRTTRFRETRLGAHATGLRIGRFTLRLSGGWLTEEAPRRNGAYGALSAYVKM